MCYRIVLVFKQSLNSLQLPNCAAFVITRRRIEQTKADRTAFILTVKARDAYCHVTFDGAYLCEMPGGCQLCFYDVTPYVMLQGHLVKCNYLHAQTEKVFLLKLQNKQNLILAPALKQ